MRTRSFLLFASLLVGCGGTTNDETAPVTAVTDPSLLFAARDPAADTLLVAAIDPASATITRASGALPGVRATTHTIDGFGRSKDEKHLVATARPLDPQGPWITFVSDERGVFREVSRSSRSESVRFNRDFSLMWREPTCDGGKDTSLRAQLVDANGKVVFETQACTAYDAVDAVHFQGFLPGGAGAFFVEHQTDLVVRAPDGTARTLRKYPSNGVAPNVIVRRVFATSAIVRHDNAFAWIDFEGHTLDVPGFSRAGSALATDDFMVADTQLSKLADRAVVPLQRVPAGTNVHDVQGAEAGRFAVLVSSGKLHTAGPSGGLRGSYEVPLGHRAAIDGAFGALAAPTPWMVVTFHQTDEDRGDYTPSYGHGEILVRFDAEGNVKETSTLRHIVDANVSGKGGARVYQGSKSGAHLVIADNAFRVLDTASGGERVLDTPLEPVLPGGNIVLTWTSGNAAE